MMKMHITVDKLFNQMWNKQQFDLVDELFAREFQVFYPGGSVVSHADFKQMLHDWFVGFPDLHHTVEDYIAANEKICVRWQGQGTHRGIYQTIPATGKKFHYSGITIIHLTKSGQITAAWVSMDLSDRLLELANTNA